MWPHWHSPGPISQTGKPHKRRKGRKKEEGRRKKAKVRININKRVKQQKLESESDKSDIKTRTGTKELACICAGAYFKRILAPSPPPQAALPSVYTDLL